jgi:colicin import membrane protein
MLKISTLLSIGALLVVAGCGSSPQEKAKAADDAQKQANDVAANADDDGKAKAAAAQHQADQENAQKTAGAQSNADQKAAEANAALVKARADTVSASESALAALEAQVTDLKPKLVKKLARKDYDAEVKNLTELSEGVRKSIGDIATATADSLEAIKGTIAFRQKGYEQAINDAKKRL